MKATGFLVVIKSGERVEHRTYRCAWCRRDVPWCMGASDDMPDVCDDCWCAAHGLAEEPHP